VALSSNGTTTSHGLYKLDIVVIVDFRVLDLYFILFNKQYSAQFSSAICDFNHSLCSASSCNSTLKSTLSFTGSVQVREAHEAKEQEVPKRSIVCCL
jgi:hypothetical protein